VLPRHLYLHVPFCARRCTYCDFAIAVRRTVPVDEFIDAVEQEIAIRLGQAHGNEWSGEEARSDTALETLYLGGGTPSKLGAGGITRLIDVVRARFPISSAAEVTIEANPEDVTPEAAHGWREAGVNRVSLGVQSFDDRVLQWMHRTHDAAQVDRAARTLRDAAITDWSLDLIFALPPEVPRSWQDDLDRAIALGPPHISCYGLTTEPHTPLDRWRERGLVHDAGDDRYESEFLEADGRLTRAGYAHYEVSNFALPGHRARHNSAYWRRVPYIGLGPSAHSFDGAVRRWNAREYVAWKAAIDAGRDPVAGSEVLNDEAIAIEAAYLGLRTSLGLELENADLARVEAWVGQGWAEIEGDAGRLTPLGWLRLDALVADLTDLRSR
jgi:oxygen-independent coproporphyrinogen-3 oxidase